MQQSGDAVYKRLTRLGISLDLEINENVYARFIKKPKISKESKGGNSSLMFACSHHSTFEKYLR